MFLSISDDAFFTCIGIAVDTEMTTSIIHADVLADHTSTYLTLPCILYITHLLWYWWQITKQVFFW